jgi:hypothetical protein
MGGGWNWLKIMSMENMVFVVLILQVVARELVNCNEHLGRHNTYVYREDKSLLLVV